MTSSGRRLDDGVTGNDVVGAAEGIVADIAAVDRNGGSGIGVMASERNKTKARDGGWCLGGMLGAVPFQEWQGMVL